MRTVLFFPFLFFNFCYNKFILSLTNNVVSKDLIIHGRIVRRGKGKLTIGENVSINSNKQRNPVGLHNKCMIYISPKAEVVIGNNVGITSTLIFAEIGITLDDDVLIGGGCQIVDNDFHAIGFEDRMSKDPNKVKRAPIVIKKGAFIGMSSIILKGVTIGERSVVAAGSVVHKSIPDDEIWGGNPAKFIKKLL